MSNTQSRIQEQIEREYPIDNDGNLTQKVSSVTRRNAALRGAEIALENQWIRVEDELPELGECVWVYLDTNVAFKGRLMNNGWTAFFADGEKLVGENWKVTHWSYITTPPKP